MSALPDELPSIKTGPVYDAEAYVFSAELEQPIRRVIEKEAFVELPESGGYRFKPAEPLRVEGIVSHRGGYTQVAGHRGCHGRGSTTLATAALEDVNVLDVLTADRVVAQITTEHPDDGSVPSVSFLGTRFENLRIGGEKIELEPHLDILGPKPDDDESYFNDGGVFSRIAHQYANIKRMAGLPQWASDQFNWDPVKAQRLNEINCSLVNGLSDPRVRQIDIAVPLSSGDGILDVASEGQRLLIIGDRSEIVTTIEIDVADACQAYLVVVYSAGVTFHPGCCAHE